MRRVALALALGAGLIGVLVAQQRAGVEAAAPRLVVLYATCSLNKAFLAPYAPGVSYTPHLARFAEDALVFERHQTESGQSGTAFASIFSGGQAPHHGVWAHPARLDDDVLLIGEVFAAAGWDVHAWLRHPMASARLGYAQGVPAGNLHRGILRGGSPALGRILARLKRDPDYRAFLVTDFTVTHGPYQMQFLDSFCARHPGECADRQELSAASELLYGNWLRLTWDLPRTRQRLGLSDRDVSRLAGLAELVYRANVSRLDRLFGRLVDAIDGAGLAGQSLVAFTADHGEILYRPNALFSWTHGYQLAPEVLGVPLLLRGAGVPPGRYPGVSRSIDLLPTLAALAGAPLPDHPDRGVDLSRAVRRQQPPPELLAFSHTALFSPTLWRSFRVFPRLATLFPYQRPELIWVAVRSGDRLHRITRSAADEWRREAFDLAADPGLSRDLSAEPGDRETTRRLDAYRAALVESVRRVSRPEVPLVPEDLERLRALGYLE